jgi:hypothetical protein
MAGSPAAVDQAAEFLKQARRAVHLVNHHKPAGQGLQKRIGVLQAVAIGGPLKVEVNGTLKPVGDRARKGSLANLPRPEKGDRRLTTKGNSETL